jgi:hypothetical protein
MTLTPNPSPTGRGEPLDQVLKPPIGEQILQEVIYL